MLLSIFMCKCLCEQVSLVPLGLCPGKEVLIIGQLCLPFQKTVEPLSAEMQHFTFSSAIDKVSDFSISLATRLIFHFIITAVIIILMDMK